MVRRLLLVAALIALASCALPSGNSPPAPAPTAVAPTPVPTAVALAGELRFDAGGFSLRYPAGWQTRQVSNTLVLAPSMADLDRTVPDDDLVVLIDSQPLDQVAQQHGRERIEDVRALIEVSSERPRQAGYSVGEATPLSVGGVAGLSAALSAGGVRGQLVVLHNPPQAVRVLGEASEAGWEQQLPLFEAIVGSMTFFAPAPTATPADQASQPMLVTKGPPGFVLRLGGSEGPRGGRFTAARGIAVAPDGTLYLAESSRGIWAFHPDGELSNTFGKEELLDAYDVAVGSDGALFVADYSRNAITRFQPDGTLAQRWGSAGEGPEQFGNESPQRIAAGADGSVYALDIHLRAGGEGAVSSVVRFKGDDGSFIERMALPAGSAPNDLAVDQQGNIYLADSVARMVVKVDPQGRVVARLGELATPNGITASAIDLDQQGNVYVATEDAGILKLAPNGVVLARGGGSTPQGSIPPPGQFSLPNGVAVGAGEVVWVSDTSGEYSAVTALRLDAVPQAQVTAAALASAEAGADVTPVPNAATVSQWASSASASSFYEGYPPESATGPPDVAGCQDSQSAWASADPNGLEHLELRYTTPIFATAVNVHQSHRPGFITKVELLDERGSWTMVYSGTATLQPTCPAVLNVNFAQTAFRVTGVRLTLDQRSGADWNEIDAVELVGVP